MSAPLDPVKANPLAEVVTVIAEQGRVAGFERLRDIILEQPFDFGPLMAVVKMVLETDRHAIFAQVAEEKVKGRDQERKWQKLQEYLKGETDSPTVEDSRLTESMRKEENGAES